MNSEQRRLHAQTQSALETAAHIKSEIDRRLDEHLELCAMVERHAFAFKALSMLNASLNQAARDECSNLAVEAEQLLGRIKQ